MLGLKLNHVSKRGHSTEAVTRIMDVYQNMCTVNTRHGYLQLIRIYTLSTPIMDVYN